MKAIITFEESQAVCEAIRWNGHECYSNDIKECSGGYPQWHIQTRAENINLEEYDFVGAHPPCTYMTNSGVRWLYNKDGSKNIERWVQLEKSMNQFNRIKSKIKKGYLENPIPHKYARDGFESVINGKWVEGIGKYTQIIQPWQFGHGETKATCLWVIGLPDLIPTQIVEGRSKRYGNYPRQKTDQQ